MSSCLRRHCPIVWLLLFASLAANGHSEVRPSAAELKAVFLYHFASFVHWPDQAQPGAGSSFVIGVCDAPDVAAALEKATAGENIREHPIKVIRVQNARDALGCQMVYYHPGSENAGGLAQLRAHAILTVGESDQFESDGGVIRFMPDHNRIRLRINLDNARRDALQVSSQLLRIAETKGEERL